VATQASANRPDISGTDLKMSFRYKETPGNWIDECQSYFEDEDPRLRLTSPIKFYQHDRKNSPGPKYNNYHSQQNFHNVNKPLYINLEPRSAAIITPLRIVKEISVLQPPKEEPKTEMPDLDKDGIIMLLKDLLEKKKVGKLNELDKKLLKKIQEIVAANPKQYGSKVAYL
jgi:hypothetical protein